MGGGSPGSCVSPAACLPAHPAPPRSPPLQNDATKNEMSKEMVRLKKQMEHWKEQAGLPADQRAAVDLIEVDDRRQLGAED